MGIPSHLAYTLREWIARTLAARSVRAARMPTSSEELRLHARLATEDERRRDESSVRRDTGGAIRLRRDRAQRWKPCAISAAPLARGSRRATLRYGLRTPAPRHPLFAAVALLTLAIGIGANTAVFTVVNSVLLKPLPYPKRRSLVAVWHTALRARRGLSSVSGDLRLSPSMFFTYAEHNRTFQRLRRVVHRLDDGDRTGRAGRGAHVCRHRRHAAGARRSARRWGAGSRRPTRHRAAPQTVMLGYGYWQRRFGGDRSVIGRGITVDSRPREIVGVMPEGFRVVNADPDVIVPLAFDRSRQILPGFGFQGVARLKPGVTIAQASADIARMVPIWMKSWPAAPGVNPRRSTRAGESRRPFAR